MRGEVAQAVRHLVAVDAPGVITLQPTAGQTSGADRLGPRTVRRCKPGRVSGLSEPWPSLGVSAAAVQNARRHSLETGDRAKPQPTRHLRLRSQPMSTFRAMPLVPAPFLARPITGLRTLLVDAGRARAAGSMAASAGD